jgi:hypothetical protein
MTRRTRGAYLVQRYGTGRNAAGEPGELRDSFFTKRKKDLIEFEFGESGKTAYFVA